jgi:hypothetical protein
MSLAARFDFGRLVTDTRTVLARGWPGLLLVVIVVGAPMVIATSIPWWTGRDLRVWAEVTAAKAVVEALGFILISPLVTAISLQALGAAPREGLVGRAVVYGLPTALVLNSIANWASVISPLVMSFTRPTLLTQWLLGAAPLVGIVCAALFWSLAGPAAIAERRFVFGALARSAQVSRGLRLRMLALMVGYLFLFFVLRAVVWVVVVSLSAPGPERFQATAFAVNAVGFVCGPLAQIVFVSAFLQARRIADGPTEGELTDVFG